MYSLRPTLGNVPILSTLTKRTNVDCTQIQCYELHRNVLSKHELCKIWEQKKFFNLTKCNCYLNALSMSYQCQARSVLGDLWPDEQPTNDMTSSIGGVTKLSIMWYRYQPILASIGRYPIRDTSISLTLLTGWVKQCRCVLLLYALICSCEMKWNTIKIITINEEEITNTYWMPISYCDIPWDYNVKTSAWGENGCI